MDVRPAFGFSDSGRESNRTTNTGKTACGMSSRSRSNSDLGPFSGTAVDFAAMCERLRQAVELSKAGNVQPFLKWPGGKRWLAGEIAAYISAHLTGRYFEPFLGGGAVFFALRPRQAILSDLNRDLINTYRQVQNNPDILIARLRKKRVTAYNYYKVRRQNPRSSLDRAIRFLYLNRTAFGGMYRLNRKGKFNVPYGGGERTPSPLWERALLKSASRALNAATLKVSDFEDILSEAGVGDVVYCDPTYTVVHENNGFVRYNEVNFSWADQKRLALAARQANARGAVVIISNACHLEILRLYWPIKPITRARHSLMSPRVTSRRAVQEYLFVLEKQ